MKTILKLLLLSGVIFSTATSCRNAHFEAGSYSDKLYDNCYNKYLYSRDDFEHYLLQFEKRRKSAETAACMDKLSQNHGIIKQLPSKIYVNSIGMEFLLVPAGAFVMGEQQYMEEPIDLLVKYTQSCDRPKHCVEIKKSFYMSKYPVTQEQWFQVMRDHAISYRRDIQDHLEMDRGKNNQVHALSHETEKFIKMLNTKERTTRYRLPTEQEWEYVAKNNNLRYGSDYFFESDSSTSTSYSGNIIEKCKECNSKKHRNVFVEKPGSLGFVGPTSEDRELVVACAGSKYDTIDYRKSMFFMWESPADSEHCVSYIQASRSLGSNHSLGELESGFFRLVMEVE